MPWFHTKMALLAPLSGHFYMSLFWGRALTMETRFRTNSEVMLKRWVFEA